VLKDGHKKLVPATPAATAKYKLFLNSLEEGQTCEIFLEANADNGTLPQLAKIHVCIRELAKELGYSFMDMKFEVKSRAGLCVEKHVNGKIYFHCKSFKDCSVEELGLAIEAIKEIGDTVGINFH
jgi:hypothetical protein